MGFNTPICLWTNLSLTCQMAVENRTSTFRQDGMDIYLSAIVRDGRTLIFSVWVQRVYFFSVRITTLAVISLVRDAHHGRQSRCNVIPISTDKRQPQFISPRNW